MLATNFVRWLTTRTSRCRSCAVRLEKMAEARDRPCAVDAGHTAGTGLWAILGEVYGRLADHDRPLSQLGLAIRRPRTNLEASDFLNKLPFRPKAASFQPADANLFETSDRAVQWPNAEIGGKAVSELGALNRPRRMGSDDIQSGCRKCS